MKTFSKRFQRRRSSRLYCRSIYADAHNCFCDVVEICAKWHATVSKVGFCNMSRLWSLPVPKNISAPQSGLSYDFVSRWAAFESVEARSHCGLLYKYSSSVVCCLFELLCGRADEIVPRVFGLTSSFAVIVGSCSRERSFIDVCSTAV